jgi:hypothetical protein
MTMLLPAVPAIAQREIQLLPPGEADLASPRRLGSLPAGAAIALPTSPETGPVHFSWPLSSRADLDPGPTPFVATSREYWMNATGEDLARGLDLHVEAPGALVRIQPEAGSASPAVAPGDLVLEDAGGTRHAAEEALELAVSAEALRASGSPFPAGTSAFQLSPALGAGTIRIRLPRPVAPDGRYVVHVFDRGSRLAGATRTLQPTVHAGAELAVEAGLLRDAALISADAVEGFAAAPDGRVLPLQFVADGDRFRATFAVPDGVGGSRGLWEIVSLVRATEGGRTILRTVRTAFDVTLPTAALGQRARLHRDDGLRIEIPIRVAANGRYELRGVLYGTDTENVRRPLAVAHGADTLTLGNERLSLEFGAELLEASDLRAPYELRDLELRDQGRLGVLHRQHRALEIEE